MNKHNLHTNLRTIQQSKVDASSGILDIYICLMMLVFPLIFHDSYYDIIQIKYQFYYVITIMMLVLIGVLRVRSRKHSSIAFTVTDKAVIVFWLCCAISTMQSEYLYESFWGNEGRYNGLFLMSLYAGMYFSVTRFCTMKRWYAELFLFSGLLMSLIGITDYFQLDILHFRTAETWEEGKIFASTIGNINTYTSYLALFSGVSSVLFLLEKREKRAIWYFLCMAISFLAIVMGNSDNAYLAIGVLLAALPFLAVKYNAGFQRTGAIPAAFFSAMVLVKQVDLLYPDIVLGQDGLFQIIMRGNMVTILTMILWGITVFSKLINRVCPFAQINPEKLLRIWKYILIFSVLVVSIIMLDVNIFGNIKRYGNAADYFLFTESWGTNRGFIWMKALKLYWEFPFFHKLFGYGPDTFAILSTQTIRKEMLDIAGTYFDSVHNEYLHYLITIGPFGMIAYATALISGVRNIWQNKSGDRSACQLAFAMGVACYSAQAIININVPLVAPMVWLLLALGCCRQS